MPARKGCKAPPNAGKGRVKGVPNKITKELRAMILEALDGAGGVEYLQARALDTPGPFLALVGKILPLQVTGQDGKDLMPATITFVVNALPGAVNRT